MEMPVYVEDGEGEKKEMVPRFYKADLPKKSIERSVYEWYLERCFQKGALVITPPEAALLTVGQKLTLREFEEEHKKHYGNYWCSYCTDSEW